MSGFGAWSTSPSPFAASAGDSSNAQTQTGPELEEIQTEAIGFQALAGEAKVRLLPLPWPANSLPPPTASLLSIASKKGLLAAAGPESVILGGTESVRQAFTASSEEKIKPFGPQLTLPIGMRVSQVAFSSDEEYLVLSAEQGGGLAVYEVKSLTQGNTQSAFQLATNGAALRSLVPNPALETTELFAVVTTDGQLMVANLKTRHFLAGSQGQVLKEGVSCVSWSTRGKALVAGLGDGCCVQLKPEGQVMAVIPRPPALEGNQHVSSLAWLENHIFLSAHTLSSAEGDLPPPTEYHIITRQNKNPNAITYQKLPDPCPPFGLNRSPAFQFMQRLKDFQPNLQDAIIVASSASIDVGLVTRSKVPLSNELTEDKVTNVFTTTMIAEDSRRAQMPISEELSDTSPIGIALDLSSKDKVLRPLPKEEYEASPGPLPALMALNNEGVLAIWWLVYAESIRQGTTYSGLVAAAESQEQPQPQRQQSPFASAHPPEASPFGQPTFGQPPAPATNLGGPFSKLAAPAFSSTSSPTSAFGGPSALGKQSPWATSSATPGTTQTAGAAFGKPAFGSLNSLAGGNQGASFGTAGGVGNRQSPWGSQPSGTAAATGSVFGQPGGGITASSGASTFGSVAANSGGGFASFAAKPSGFMTAPPSGNAENPFGKSTPAASFGSGMDMDSSFGATPKKSGEAPKSSFGSSAFTLGSTFKGDGTAASDAPKPRNNASGSMFGGGFVEALGATQKEAVATPTKDADMGDDDNSTVAPAAQTSQRGKKETASATKPPSPKFHFPQPSQPPSTGGLFGTQSQSKNTPAAVQNSQPAPISFGKPSPTPIPASTTPKDTPKKPDQRFLPSIETSPRIKEEPQSDEDEISPLNEEESAPPQGYDMPETPQASKAEEAPLPPESTSKASFAPGDSSNSSKSSDDAPLPPDFLPSKKPSRLSKVEPAPAEEAALPSGSEDEEVDVDGEESDEDDGRSDESGEAVDDEGSGVDVAQEISPSTDPTHSPKITPGSSFGVPLDKTPPGGLFSRITHPQDAQKSRSLFGEVGKTSAPYLPPPTKTKQSPRSPSPMRANLLGDTLRPDSARSVSAPGPFPALTNRKQALSQFAVPSKPQLSADEIRKQERGQLAAKRAREAAEEEQNLSDREDEMVREELATEVEPTKILDQFLAHQDYIGAVEKPGIPGQIEKVYRDINSMIDTLGLNARSLKAFIKGHEVMREASRRGLDDLEDEDWCLVEIDDLACIEDELASQLEDGKMQDVQEKVNECRDLRKASSGLRTKGADVSRAIDARSDPPEIESTRTAPLRIDQATQQHEIRRKLTHFQKLLAEAEENLILLRTKLASCESDNGKEPPMKKPTVEAVTNTIMKMTAIIEKKSREIDILEMQMRSLRSSSVDSLDSQLQNLRFSTQSSREGSLFTPGASSRKPGSFRLGNSRLQNGHSKSPELARSMRRSPGKNGIVDMAPEEVQGLREKVERKAEINRIIRDAFIKSGPRIRPLE